MPQSGCEIPDRNEGKIMPDLGELDRARVKTRKILWDHAGIIRDREGLRRAQRALNHLAFLDDSRYLFITRRQIESLNVYHLARIITAAALFREESRGSHFRRDFPRADDTNWKAHSLILKGEKGEPLVSKEIN